MDHLGQGVLRRHLKAQINGQLHIVAGLRRGEVFLLQHLAGGENGGLQQAVGTVEVLLKGIFYALLAHHGVHGVVGVEVFVLVGVHGARMAQQMGGIGGVVFPDRGGLHQDAGDAQLHHRRQVFRGDVPGQNVVIQGHSLDGPQLQLKADGDQPVGLLLGEAAGNIVVLPEVAHQVLG